MGIWTRIELHHVFLSGFNAFENGLEWKRGACRTVTVENTGKIAGKEVLQWYISDLYASVTPAGKKLKGFQKIALLPGERKTVSFTITPEMLKFYGVDNQWIAEPGEFILQVGNQSANFQLK